VEAERQRRWDEEQKARDGEQSNATDTAPQSRRWADYEDDEDPWDTESDSEEEAPKDVQKDDSDNEISDSHKVAEYPPPESDSEEEPW
jgi:hypothetical protein